jgi:hypothetical protein
VVREVLIRGRTNGLRDKPSEGIVRELSEVDENVGGVVAVHEAERWPISAVLVESYAVDVRLESQRLGYSADEERTKTYDEVGRCG